MNITVLQPNYRLYRPLFDFVTMDTRNYCLKHGYKYKVINEITPIIKREMISWYNLEVIIRILEKKLKNIDWFFWIDASSFIMNEDIKLESFIENAHQQYHIAGYIYSYKTNFYLDVVDGEIIKKDGSFPMFGMFTGSFFIRNSDKALEILKRLYFDERFYKTKHLNENILAEENGFGFYYTHDIDFRSKIFKIENKTFITGHQNDAKGLKMHFDMDVCNKNSFIVRVFQKSVDYKLYRLKDLKKLKLE